MTSIVFAHGLEGSPNGRKIQALRAAGFTVDAPDGRGDGLDARVAALEVVTRGRQVVLVGSSYGGLAAAHLAVEYPERFMGLLLLAPALHRSEPPVADAAILSPPTGVPTIVIHGTRDAVVPVEVSRRYVAGGGAEFFEVDDDHRLAASQALMINSARRLLQISDTTLDDI